jgi:hypothetical protein
LRAHLTQNVDRDFSAYNDSRYVKGALISSFPQRPELEFSNRIGHRSHSRPVDNTKSMMLACE